MHISKHLEGLKPSYIREILGAAKADGVISLAGGLPASEHLPVELMMQAITALQSTPEVFQYGETAGYPAFLSYLSEVYNLQADSQLMITNGSQQGLDLVARAFIDPDDTVVMEAPSYLGALQVFELAKANIVSVEQTASGPDLEQLEHAFKTQAPKLFYAVPDFHNPTGIQWSLAVRQQVAQLCEQYDVALIEDVPYRDLSFNLSFNSATDLDSIANDASLPLVSSLCANRAITLRSFSKISAPGVRLGSVVGPSEWINALIKVKQAADLHTSQPMQAALLHLLQQPSFEQHLNNIRQLYSQRCQTLSKLLREKLPNCSFNDVQGGMFLWLDLPKMNVMSLAERALKQGVAVVPSNVFYSTDRTPPAALRLNFSHSSATQLEVGVERLALAMKTLI